MSGSLESVQVECLEVLTKNLRVAKEKRDAHRSDADRLDVTCKSLSQAIRAIEKAQEKPQTRRTPKRCADKREIFQLALEAVTSIGAMRPEDLHKLVKTKLRERGRNLSMSAKLLGACLREKPFSTTSEGMVALAAEDAAPGKTAASTQPKPARPRDDDGQKQPRGAAANRATSSAHSQASREAAADRRANAVAPRA